MALKSGLTAHLYNINADGAIIEISENLNSLGFTTVAPGGWGDLSAAILVQNSSIVPPELQLFANIAVSDGLFAIFEGRLDQSAIAIGSNGVSFNIHALGGGTCLKDDPEDSSYINETAQFIITDQIQGATLGRPNFLPLDQDLSFVLTDAPVPVATYTEAYNGNDIEEILNSILTSLGDYQWCVWDHPRNKDRYNFPTWTLYMHNRISNPSLPDYVAHLDADITDYSIAPAIEYSYNAVEINYKDLTTGLPASVYTQDARLNGNKSQGTAPFPFRLLRKDLADTIMSSGQAASVANALLNEYLNGGYKINVTLASVSDSLGVDIPLWRVRADTNILIPSITPTGTPIPSNLEKNTNMFYITQTSYSENADSLPTLQITCNTFYDTAAFQIARMQYISQEKTKSKTVSGVTQKRGLSEKGMCGVSWGPSATTGNIFTQGVNFKTMMAQTPSSITLTALDTNNAGATSVVNLTQYGFVLHVVPNANGAGYWNGSYQTNGN